MSNIYWNLKIGSLLAASPKAVFENKEYWRLFTSTLIHGDLAHILSNSFSLSIIGYAVASQYGLYIFPIFSFLMGIFINLIVISTYSNNTTLVGASGVVYFLWGFWLVLYILIQKDVSINRRFMKVTAVGIFILAPSSYKANVSYLAHGVGLILGLASGFFYYFIKRSEIIAAEQWEIITEDDDDLSDIEEIIDVQKDEPPKYLH